MTICPVCKQPSHTSRKVRPFCCVAHRSVHTRNQIALDNERLMATRAKPGDLVENGGVVCRVKKVSTIELADTSFKAKTRWESDFETVCGQFVEFPLPLENAVVTCIACISEGDLAHDVHRKDVRSP